MQQRALLALIIAGFVAAAAYSGWWFWVADRVASEIDAWRSAQAEKGVRVEIGEMSIDGFPGHIRVNLSDAAIGAETGAWAIRVPRVDGRLAPWQLQTIHGSFGGRIFAATALPTHSAAYEIDLDQGTYVVDGHGALAVDVALDGVHVRRTDSDTDVVVDRVSLQVAQLQESEGLRLGLDVDTLKLGDRPISPLGDTVERVRSTIDMIGEMASFGSTEERLRSWSEAGGIAEVRSLSAAHGALRLSGDGTVSLDRDLQPEGAFSAEVAGYADAVDALAQSGVMGADEAKIAKAVLGFLSTRPAPGRDRIIEVPITLQDRQLSAGPVRLFRVPRINW